MNMNLQATTLLTVVFLAAGREAIAIPTVDHCLSSFEESLQQTMALKKSCEEANLKDCCQIAEASKIISNDNFRPNTGIYDISNVCQTKSPFTQDVYPPMQARCDMDSGDGGWTVLIRRTPDSPEREHFNRTWDDYVEGFGDLNGEFWYGLKNMHCLTSREPMEVEVEMKKKGSESIVLSYDNFKIDGPTTSYTLYVSGKKDNHNDFFSYHNGMKFSTPDRDNDRSSRHCAASSTLQGWWYNACSHMALTATPNPLLYSSATADVFYDYAELRVRPKNCTGLRNDPDTCE